MKLIHVIHAVLTLVLGVALLVIGALLALGILELRHASGDNRPGAEQKVVEADKVKARLVVIRGARPNSEYPIYEGTNVVGRADQKPVEIDLFAQETPDRVWSSRQHAIIIWENGVLSIEDLNTTNGTFVNRDRVQVSEKKTLKVNDII